MLPAVTRKILTGTLLVTASAIAMSSPAHAAHKKLFASNPETAEAALTGRRVTQTDGVTQVRLENGGIASFVDSASYTINEDGGIDLYSGSVTVTGSVNGAVVVRLADKGQASVQGADSAASFSVDAEGASGHVLTGSAQVALGNGSPQIYTGGQMWRGNGNRPSLVIANNEQTVPGIDGSGAGGEEPAVLAIREGGPLAAAVNGLPVVLGDGLAAVGATGDILAAARRVDQAFANPSVDTFPADDFALLAAYAGRLEGAFGGQPFDGAQADIIRTYIQFLAGGGAGNDGGASFLTTYAGLTAQYLDLIRAGALPSSFGGANRGQIHAYLGFIDRTSGFGGLSDENGALVDAYLAFISGGGTANNFTGTYTDLTEAYFAFLRTGGAPADFQQASLGLVEQYLAFLSDSGLSDLLSGSDQALLAAYLGNGGLAFASQYESALGAYFTHLAAGKLPSAYGAVDPATLQTYLETLQSTGLFAQVLGGNAGFYANYLAFLQTGGQADAFAGLPANIFAGYTGDLDTWFAYLAGGGLPSAYTGDLTALQAYLVALDNAGALTEFLGQNAGFYSAYLAHLQNGGSLDSFTGLNVNIFTGYGTDLAAYYSYLLQGGVPSSYGALTQAQIAAYLTALDDAGASGAFLDQLNGFYSGYFAFVSGGGNPDAYTGLPVLNLPIFADALNAYFAFINGGGLPSGYSAEDLDALNRYFTALVDSGQAGTLLGGNLNLLSAYFAYFGNNGANVDQFGGLPVYAGYASALSTYFAFLDGGGLPDDYTALSAAQIQSYLVALGSAGGIGSFFGTDQTAFYTNYFAFLQSGGSPSNFADLPVYLTYISALNDYYVFLENGGFPADYTALSPTQISAYLAALQNAGGFTQQLGIYGSFYSAYFAHLGAGGSPATFSGLPVYADYASALSAYYAFLNGGGLPADYTALTPAQISAYLTALNGAGGFNAQLGNLSSFYSAYFAHIGGGGTGATFSGLPVYADYVSALSAYYAFLNGGGLPADYTALTPAQISAYLTALNGAGGFNGQLGNLSSFYSAYFAHLGNGGTGATFSGLPVYADYLTAIQAFYAFVAGGGLPSDYTALSAAQIQAYLGALSGSGLLVGNFNGGDLSLLQAYLAFLTGGGNYDQFADLPVNVGPAGPSPQFATARVYRYSSDGGSVRDAATVDVEDDGRITGATGSDVATFDYTGDEALAVEQGRAGDDVAWTRYDRGSQGSSISNYQEHVMAGVPATNLPTSGTVSYKLIGGTAPTDAFAPSGEAGSFSGEFAVAFQSIPKVGLEMDVYTGDRGWHLQTDGGAADPADNGLFLGSDMAFADNGFRINLTGTEGDACDGNCSFSLFGSLFGEGAAHAGFAYLIDDRSGDRSFVNGTAVFGQSGTELDILGTKPIITPPVVEADPLVWIFNTGGGRIGTAPTFNVEPSGQITQTGLQASPSSGVQNFDFTAASNVLQDHGWVEDVVAWTRYEQPAQGILTNIQSHVMLGSPALNLPASGLVSYALIGGTAPTDAFGPAGEIGSFAGELSVLFGTTNWLGLSADIFAGERGWHVETNGGTANPSNGGVAIGANMTFSSSAFLLSNLDGNACSGFCSFSGFGGIFGDGASHAGLTYLIQDESSGHRSYVNGSAVFGPSADAITHLGTLPSTGGGTGTPATALTTTFTGTFADGGTGARQYWAGSYYRAIRNDYIHFTGSSIDSSGGTNVVIDNDGLESFNGSAGGVSRSGQTVVAETYGNDRLLIGRWDTSYDQSSLPGDQSMHYLLAAPLMTPANLPTNGTINYRIVEATSPTSTQGYYGEGVFEADLAIAFGAAPKVGIEGTISMPENGQIAGDMVYSFATTGGAAAPAGFIDFDGTGSMSFSTQGSATNGTSGTIKFQGKFADEQASLLGLTYHAQLYRDSNRVYLDGLTGAALFGDTTIYPAAAAIVSAPESGLTTADIAGSAVKWDRFEVNVPGESLTASPLSLSDGSVMGVTRADAEKLLSMGITFSGRN